MKTIYMRVLIFNIIWDNLVSSGNITCTYVLVVDRTCSSLYEIPYSIKKYLSRNSIRYIMQQKGFSIRVPNNLLLSINSLYSINFGTSEVIRAIKGELVSLFTKKLRRQRVGYIYEKDI